MMNSEYSEPHSSIPRPLAILAIIATHVAALSAMVVVLCAVVPSHVKVFADFGAELPAMTNQVIALSNLTVHYWYIILPLAAIADAVVVWTLASMDSSQRWLLAMYSHACLLATIVFLVWVAIAICVPMIGLVDALKG